jgi:Family of unknown function (DUF6088)
MYSAAQTRLAPPQTAAKAIRERIEKGGETLWRMEDFLDLPSAAVAQALSRLARAHLIQRLSKGTYYRPRQSTFGQTRPNPNAIRKLASRKKTIFPAGTAAANLLGFTTQTARFGEASTSASSLPRKLIGPDMVIHTRRPEAWANLSETEAALLDFLRRRGRVSELTPEETIARTESLLSQPRFLEHLFDVAMSEPPRVRAILGALGERLGVESKKLDQLRRSLNPLSKFDFGIFSALPNAQSWQAKGA